VSGRKLTVAGRHYADASVFASSPGYAQRDVSAIARGREAQQLLIRLKPVLVEDNPGRQAIVFLNVGNGLLLVARTSPRESGRAVRDPERHALPVVASELGQSRQQDAGAEAGSRESTGQAVLGCGPTCTDESAPFSSHRYRRRRPRYPWNVSMTGRLGVFGSDPATLAGTPPAVKASISEPGSGSWKLLCR